MKISINFPVIQPLTLVIAILFCASVVAQNKTTQTSGNENIVDKDSITIKQDSTESEEGFFNGIVHYFEEAREDKSFEKFDFSIIGAPTYSVNTKLGVGIAGVGQYRLDKQDSTLSPSNATIFTNISTAGFFKIGIRNHTIFPGDRYRIDADLSFNYRPRKFYGVGYAAGRSDKHTKLDEFDFSGKVDFLKKVYQDFYAGLSLKARNVHDNKFKNEDFKEDLINKGEGMNNTRVGMGYIFSYDTRDFIPNPKKGMHIELKQIFFPKAFGSSSWSNKIKFMTDVYHQFWHNGTVAFDVNGVFNKGDTPWNMMALMGSSHAMRGYYFGRYRDKDQVDTQVEIRQKIKGRHGVAVWGGAGTVFDSFNDWNWHHILPTYGFGYRWEFKDRINLRFDYGIGKGESGFYFSVKEAF